MIHSIRIFVVLIIAIILTSCGGDTPIELPYAGAFYQVGDEYIDLPSSHEYPFSVSSRDPIIKELPALFLKYTVPSVDNITLRNVGNNQAVFTTVNILDNGNFVITPENTLPDGDYCLVIGDAMKTHQNLSRWCFKIGDADAIAATAEAKQQELENKLRVEPPSDDILFHVDDELNLQEIPWIKLPVYNILDEYNTLPIIATNPPVVVLKSANFNIDNFFLYKGRPLFGIRLDGDSSPCTVKRSDGFDFNPAFGTGDKILSINDTPMENCEQVLDFMFLQKPGSFRVEVQRGTYTGFVDAIAEDVNYRTHIPIIHQFNGNYVGFYPTEELSPGIYCFTEKGWAKGFCFRIE